jgi:hypothetical protein
MLGDVGDGLDGGFGFHVPMQKLLADAGDLAINAAGFDFVAGVEQGEREARAVGVGQSLDGAIAGDDAVVIASAEENPVTDLTQESQGFGGSGIG